MAKPVGFEGANMIMQSHMPGSNDLQILNTKEEMVSCWKFSDEELKAIIENDGHVWLSVLGQTGHPHVKITGDPGYVTINGKPSKPEPYIKPPQTKGK
jgi:hypothetical protein